MTETHHLKTQKYMDQPCHHGHISLITYRLLIMLCPIWRQHGNRLDH